MSDDIYIIKLIAVACILINLSFMEMADLISRDGTLIAKVFINWPKASQFVQTFVASGRRFRLIQRAINLTLFVLSFYPFNLGFAVLNAAMFLSSWVTSTSLAASPLRFLKNWYGSLLYFLALLEVPTLATIVFGLFTSTGPELAWWSHSLALLGAYGVLLSFFGLMAGFLGRFNRLHIAGYIQGCVLMAYGAYLGGPKLLPFVIMEAGLALIFIFFFLQYRTAAVHRN